MLEADLKGDGKIDQEEWKEFVAKNPSLIKNMTLPYLKWVLASWFSIVFLVISHWPYRLRPKHHANELISFKLLKPFLMEGGWDLEGEYIFLHFLVHVSKITGLSI